MPRKKKEKPPKVDGLSADDGKRIKNAIRQAWQWSHMWRLVKARCKLDGGFSKCEHPECDGVVHPKIFVDHIVPAGSPIEPGYIERMFCPSSGLQGLCKKHHDRKTREEKDSE